MADREKNPSFDLANLKLGQNTRLKLKYGKPVKTGTNKFGEWNLWVAEVQKGTPVTNFGSTTVRTDYEGEVTFFGKSAHKHLLAATNGTQEGVTVDLSIEAKEGEKGIYRAYNVKVVEGGSTPPNSLSQSHHHYIEFFEKMVKSGVIQDNKDDFAQWAHSKSFNTTMPDLNAELIDRLWAVYEERKKK